MVMEAEGSRAGRTSILIWAIASAALCVLLVIVGLRSPQQPTSNTPPSGTAAPATNGPQNP
jgi:hypothetical protein